MLFLESTYVRVCFCVGMCMWVQIPMAADEGVGSPEAQGPGGADQPDVVLGTERSWSSECC